MEYMMVTDDSEHVYLFWKDKENDKLFYDSFYKKDSFEISNDYKEYSFKISDDMDNLISKIKEKNSCEKVVAISHVYIGKPLSFSTQNKHLHKYTTAPIISITCKGDYFTNLIT